MSQSRSLVRPFKQISAGDMSGSLLGLETNVEFCDDALIYVEWTGNSPVGTLTIEFLKKPSGNTADEEWVSIDFGSPIAISGNTGSHTIQFTELPFTKIRPRYTRTSGAGSLTVSLMAKGA